MRGDGMAVSVIGWRRRSKIVASIRRMLFFGKTFLTQVWSKTCLRDVRPIIAVRRQFRGSRRMPLFRQSNKIN
jgi:hypothetical protein